ncbi:LysR substrate-binding domain-containing protein [Actinoalloteichus hymeniacidonis]|uniref:Transcriptional regulator n=1 Tax=Actinoalloteichus hymeniacidonis TaxID=340345 RepID=A0AAC9HMK5_9PSEU|nr:LysR substrate-binding domain-containing protein [Actinoalloteichus hymeniacidonis]AOS61521.1 transcriptional regulator [Actinoalloteichus hymeniacidonis]MBB5910471.1 DNA-binding transcriptional LysR family regulator [Actinoalloteichus hymeniacidonis]
MEYLVALADEQQFTRAAAVCRVSQSGLSAGIRNLEGELGTPLFTRTTRRVEPTDAGLALLPFARTMLAQVAAGRDAVIRATHALAGRLRVGAEQCLGVVDVPPLLERFHRRYPLVDIHFTQSGSHDLAGQVRAGELDVAFVATTEHLATVNPVELGRRAIVLLVPAEHPLAGRSDVEWAELRDREFIDFRTSWGVRSLNEAACAAHGVGRRVRCTVDDIHTLLDLIHRGLGIALVPQHVAAKPQAAGLVTIRLPAATSPQWIVSAITSNQAEASASRLLELVGGERSSTNEVMPTTTTVTS